jgi:hypothetical protein
MTKFANEVIPRVRARGTQAAAVDGRQLAAARAR